MAHKRIRRLIMANFDTYTTTCYFTGDNRYMIAAIPIDNTHTRIQVFSLASVDVHDVVFTRTTDEDAYDSLIEKLKNQYDVSREDFDEIYNLMDNGQLDEAETKTQTLRERLPFEPEITGILTSIFLEKL